jgi:putative acetyltransferase
VAWLGGRIVGTGALVTRVTGTAEIVRMSVRADVRRQGIGCQILDQLVARARSLGCKKVILETTATWQEVIAFYLQNGFRITHRSGDDVYFERILAVSPHLHRTGVK